MTITLRKISSLGLFLCAVVIATALYLEHEYMLATCPLCILQRIVFITMGGIFLLGIIFRMPGKLGYVYSSILILLAAIGAAIATRQIWLQYFAPPQKVSCAASLERLMDLYPFLDALKIALSGAGECAIIDFTILGLSIAVWSLLLFVAMGLGMIGVIYLRKKRQI